MLTFPLETAAQREHIRRMAALEAQAVEPIARMYVEAMKKVEKQVVDLLARGYAPEELGAVLSRAGGIVAEVDRLIAGQVFEREVALALGRAAPTAVEYGEQYALAAMRSGDVIADFSLSPDLVQRMVARTQPGRQAAMWARGLGEETVKQVNAVLVESTALGHGPREVAREMRKITQTGVRQTETFVRTVMMNNARESSMETYRANDDVVTGWIWNAAEDRRTCSVCFAMHGSLHPLSEPFSSHVNCRCTPDPVTAEWTNLGLRGPRETRVYGSDPDAAFGELTREEKVRILGPTRLGMWEDGKIKMPDIPQRTYHRNYGPGLRARTLRELNVLWQSRKG